jgi:hypothetical protein
MRTTRPASFPIAVRSCGCLLSYALCNLRLNICSTALTENGSVTRHHGLFPRAILSRHDSTLAKLSYPPRPLSFLHRKQQNSLCAVSHRVTRHLRQFVCNKLDHSVHAFKNTRKPTHFRALLIFQVRLPVDRGLVIAALEVFHMGQRYLCWLATAQRSFVCWAMVRWKGYWRVASE